MAKFDIDPTWALWQYLARLADTFRQDKTRQHKTRPIGCGQKSAPNHPGKRPRTPPPPMGNAHMEATYFQKGPSLFVQFFDVYLITMMKADAEVFSWNLNSNILFFCNLIIKVKRECRRCQGHHVSKPKSLSKRDIMF